jgi:hypothetical protein
MGFYGLPPIGQKQRRPMDGAQFRSPWVGEAGGRLRSSQPYSLTGNCGGVGGTPKRGVERTGRIRDGFHGSEVVRHVCLGSVDHCAPGDR